MPPVFAMELSSFKQDCLGRYAGSDSFCTSNQAVCNGPLLVFAPCKDLRLPSELLLATPASTQMNDIDVWR